jgi:hypothetical protein
MVLSRYQLSLFFWLSVFSAFSQTPQWAQRIGGSQADESNGLAVMPNGKVITTGIFRGVGTFGNPQNQISRFSRGGADAFLMCQHTDGTLQWVVSFGSRLEDEANDVKTDQSGNIYVVGNFQDTLRVAGSGGTVLQAISRGGQDAYVCKFDSLGQAIWLKTFGGLFPSQPHRDNGYCLALSGLGAVYVGGTVGDTATFDGNPNWWRTNGTSAVVVKYDQDGNFIWFRPFAAQSISNSSAIRALAANDEFVWATGSFRQAGKWGTNGDSLVSPFGNSGSSIFLVKANSNGEHLWSRIGACRSTAIGRDLSLGSAGDIYMIGRFRDSITYFGIGNDSRKLFTAGVVDITAARYLSDGTLAWAISDGGRGNDVGIAASTFLNGSGFMYTAYFQDTAQFGGINSYISKGLSDVVVCGYDSTGTIRFSTAFGSVQEDIAYGLEPSIHQPGFFISGYFLSTINFGSGVTISASPSSVRDGFVAFYSLPITDLKSLEKAQTITFSNPAMNGRLSIFNPYQDCTFELLTPEGKKLYSEKLSKGFSSTQLAVKVGVYFIKFTTNSGHEFQKLIVK